MPTTLGELIQESNRYSGGNMPAQQMRVRASVIEDVMEDPNYNGGGAFGEPVGAMSKGNRNPPGISLDYQRNNQSNFSPNLDISMLRNEKRTISLDSAVAKAFREPSTNMLSAPVYAGTAPPLQSYASKAVPMNRIREKFRGAPGGQTCIDTLNHINNCPMCARYFQCDSKVYHVIIFMLIILFLTILYFVCKEDNKLR
jgi:hypothetical protein